MLSLLWCWWQVKGSVDQKGFPVGSHHQELLALMEAEVFRLCVLLQVCNHPVLLFFQMAVPFSKGASAGQKTSRWLSPSVPSSKTCPWTSAWTCARRGWGDNACVSPGKAYMCIGSCSYNGFLCQEKSLAVLGRDRCYCGFPTPLFSLHDLEDEDMCLHRCPGEEFESCGNDQFFVVYQTQVQGKSFRSAHHMSWDSEGLQFELWKARF